MVPRLWLKVKSLKINSRKKKKEWRRESIYKTEIYFSLLEKNFFFFPLLYVSLFTSESAVGGCLTAVMPKSKPNTSQDFF